MRAATGPVLAAKSQLDSSIPGCGRAGPQPGDPVGDRGPQRPAAERTAPRQDNLERGHGVPANAHTSKSRGQSVDIPGHCPVGHLTMKDEGDMPLLTWQPSKSRPRVIDRRTPD
jgi:hypothetical protein